MDGGGFEHWSAVPTGESAAHPFSCPVPDHRGSHTAALNTSIIFNYV